MVMYPNTLDYNTPTASSDINLATFLATVHSQPQQVMPQVIQEILKSFGMDLEKN